MFRQVKGIIDLHLDFETCDWIVQDEKFIHFIPPNSILAIGSCVYLPQKGGEPQKAKVKRMALNDGRPLPDPPVGLYSWKQLRADGFEKLGEQGIDEEFLLAANADLEPHGLSLDSEIPAGYTFYAPDEGGSFAVTIELEDGTEQTLQSDELLIERWEYEGMNYIHPGDLLIVFSKDDVSKIIYAAPAGKGRTPFKAKALKKYGIDSKDAEYELMGCPATLITFR